MEENLKKNEDIMNKEIYTFDPPFTDSDHNPEVMDDLALKKDSKKKAVKKTNGEFKKFRVSDCAKLNIRVAPDVSSDVVKTVNNGDLVKVDMSFENSEFYKVMIGNDEYYAMKKFLK